MLYAPFGVSDGKEWNVLEERSIPAGPASSEDVEELTMPQKFQCDECGRWFDTKQGLGRHKTTTHGAKSKRPKRVSRKSTRAPFNREAALGLVVGKSIPVRSLGRIEAWLNEGEAIYKDSGSA